MPAETYPHERELLEAYRALRHAAYLLGRVQDERSSMFTEGERKALDKATVLGQVQYKMVKRILSKRGVKTGKARMEAIRPD